MMKRLLKAAFFTGLFLLLPGLGLYAQSESDEALLKRVDSLASYYGADFSAQYTFVQDKPGQERTTTVAGVFRRDSDDTYVIIIMQPDVSRGQGYLKQGKTLWVYDPDSKRFNSTSSADRFQNTNARNSDFTRSTLAQDYKIVSGKNETLGRFNCRVLTLEAVTTEVTYPCMKVWISEDGLIRKAENYSLSWTLMRTMAFPDYYAVGGRHVPKSILIVDALKGATIDGRFVNEKTQVTISKPSFAKVADSTYSKTFLESVSR
jgi:outer membrane lipoprotein-sorting protein